MEIGYGLSSEEHSGSELLRIAQMAAQCGFQSLTISDHFHPWLDDQGQSPFVWSVLGGLATTGMRVTTTVTCPTMRIHPVVIAQAAATCAEMMPGRFRFGIGTGENLNEHVTGQTWPPGSIRLEMLEEAVELMRRLWTGEMVTHVGRYYTTYSARIYTRPPEPPPILISAFGEHALQLAARIGEGLVETKANKEKVQKYVEYGGRGPKVAGMKLCWAETEAQAKTTAHKYWRHTCIPGQIAQELAIPNYFDQAAAIVTEDDIAKEFPCGPDPEPCIQAIEKYREAGFDELYLTQIGPDQAGFFRFYRRELMPRLSGVIGRRRPVFASSPSV